MIPATKKHLTLIFFSIIIAFNILLLCISYFSMYQSIMRSMKYHLSVDDKKEFKAKFFFSDIDSFQGITDDEIIHILDKDGVIVSTFFSKNYAIEFSQENFQRALDGEEIFDFQEIDGIEFLVFYFPLTKQYVGRIAEPLIQLMEYERNFVIFTVILFPGVLLLSFFISRYLVNQAMIPITEAFRFQENFSSNVSHELQTPLASLKGNLEVALRNPRKVEEYREVIRLGLKETNRIIALSQDLYLLASSSFKSLSLFHEEVDLKDLFEDIKLNFLHKIEAKQMSLKDHEIHSAPCLCDAVLIQRTLENLMDNAIKYCPEKGEITVSIKRHKDEWQIRFDNPCEIISQIEANKLTNPFVRGSNAEASEVEGKGLGLNIVKYIVRSHKGSVKINISEDHIFSIMILLPIMSNSKKSKNELT
ncbi:MAG: HAMP domain-containing histidine kinase [Deltaproteobacteria bacterium]|nr:HAMP domain-containing histidine kinase [Deltaproteobacteria bacterium]